MTDVKADPQASPGGVDVLPVDQLEDQDRDTMFKFIRRDLLFSFDSCHLEVCLAENAPKNLKPPSPDDVKWETGGNEKEHHSNFSYYLNLVLTRTRASFDAVDAVDRCALDSIFTDNFRWLSYDKQAESGLKNKYRPGVVGCILKNDAEKQMLELAMHKSKSDDSGTTAKKTGSKSNDLDNTTKKTSTRIISWEHLVSYVEVENNWSEMIVQCADYARLTFAHQPQRVAVRCLAYNQHDKGAVIIELDRAGGYATPIYNLNNKRGLREFSFLLAGMYCSSTEAHGYNPRWHQQVNNDEKNWTGLKVFSNKSWLYVNDVLFNRINIWGRCTRAVAAQRTQDEQNVITKRMRPQRPVVSERPEIPLNERIGQKLFFRIEDSKPNYSKFFLIEYWNHISHRDDDELQAIQKISNVRKGNLIVRGLACYGASQKGRVSFFAQGPAKDCKKSDYYYRNEYTGLDSRGYPRNHAEDTAETLTAILNSKGCVVVEDPVSPNCPKSPPRSLRNAFERSDRQSEIQISNPLPRIETIQECLDVGRSLYQAKDELELVEAILGAMKGYLNLYNLGYVHRDISPGKVVIVDPSARQDRIVADIHASTEDNRKKFLNTLHGGFPFETVSQNDAKGMLILKQDPERDSTEQSHKTLRLTGTRAFIAMRVLRKPSVAPSAVHDMESFVWVFLYTALVTKHKGWTTRDKEWFNDYLKPKKSYKTDAFAKEAFLGDLKLLPIVRGVLKPYGPYIQQMAIAATKYKDQAFVEEDAKEKRYKYAAQVERGAIQEYIRIFEDLASSLRGAKAPA